MVYGRMAQADTDGDGSLSREEFVAKLEQIYGTETCEADSRGGWQGLALALFDQADTDGDTRLTLAEFQAAAIPLYSALTTLDVNHSSSATTAGANSVTTTDELTTGMAAASTGAFPDSPSCANRKCR